MGSQQEARIKVEDMTTGDGYWAQRSHGGSQGSSRRMSNRELRCDRVWVVKGTAPIKGPVPLH